MRRLITDFRHKNRDETDMIMVKIRDMRIWRQAQDGGWEARSIARWFLTKFSGNLQNPRVEGNPWPSL
jgi:hypothetical protein